MVAAPIDFPLATYSNHQLLQGHITIGKEIP